MQTEEECHRVSTFWDSVYFCWRYFIPGTVLFIFVVEYVCLAMLCIRAAYAVVRCLSACLSVTFVYSVETHKHINLLNNFTISRQSSFSIPNNIMAIFRRDPLTGQKSRFSTNIWVWDRRLVECQQFRQWGKLHRSRRWRRSPSISEPCLWQQASTSLLAFDSYAEENRTEFNCKQWSN